MKANERKRIEAEYEKVLISQRKVGIFAAATGEIMLYYILVLIPASFYSILSKDPVLIIGMFGCVILLFGLYFIIYSKFAKLEVLELYYLTLLKRHKHGNTTKRSTRKI